MSHNPYAPPSTTVADIEQPSDLVRPRNATIAMRMFWVMTMLGFGAGIVGIFFEDIPAGVPRGAVLAVALVVMLIIFGLMCWVLRATGRGKNWGRVTLTVLLAIGVLAVLFAPEAFNSSGVVQRASYFLQLAVEIVGMVLLFTPSSNAWFAAHRAASK
jgi:hypothetical protein